METIRFFRSQTFSVEAELTEAQAAELDAYVRAVFRDGRPTRAELIGGGALERVAYYECDWPSDRVRRVHRELYPGIGATIISAKRPVGDERYETTSTDLDAALEIEGRWTRLCNGDDELLLEEHFAADGTLIEGMRYEWRRGDVERVWLRAADGNETLDFDANE